MPRAFLLLMCTETDTFKWRFSLGSPATGLGRWGGRNRPLARKSRRLYLKEKCLKLSLLLLLGLLAATAMPQSFDASSAGGPVAITASWRFHTGDDAQWAAPGLDDSHWSLLRPDKPWALQGYGGYYGFSWYRMKVKLPATQSRLALGFHEVNSADEIYADGRLIGSIGRMRPVPVWLGYAVAMRSFPLPRELNGRTIELAIRVWQPQASSNDSAAIGLVDYPLVGTAQAIANLCAISRTDFAMSGAPDWISSFIAVGIGLCSLGLFLLRRRAREYAWAAVFLLDGAFLNVGEWFYHTYQWPAFDWILLADCLGVILHVFWLLFIWRFLRAPADWLLRAGIAILLPAPIPILLARQGYLSLNYANLTWVVIPLALVILVVARLVRLAWQGNRDAQLLLVPFLLSNVMNAISEAVDFLYWVGVIKDRRGYTYLAFYHGSAFSLTWSWLFELLADLAVAVLLMLRFARSAERDERLSAEMEAAHSVQAQLVPAQLPRIPHFQLEAAYRAASEVGGDFYQIFPQPDDSVLVAIGDVSGKGLKAAMLGTLVVGALRTLAAESLRPAQILARLNTQLAASTDGGFVTCAVAHLLAGGRLTLANAGHLPPYRNGSELKTASGLPLGVIPSAEYTEAAFALEPGDRLTFLSDGVVEARNPSGELFGFDRAAALSTESAQAIARAAQAHGQEDDITVLTLTLAPSNVPA